MSCVQIRDARDRPVYKTAAQGRIRPGDSTAIGWKFAVCIGYPDRWLIVPREWGRLVCSTEACKHGSSESVGPVPLAKSRKQLAVTAAHASTARCLIALTALNTGTEGKFRGIYDILPRSRGETERQRIDSELTANSAVNSATTLRRRFRWKSAPRIVRVTHEIIVAEHSMVGCQA